MVIDIFQYYYWFCFFWMMVMCLITEPGKSLMDGEPIDPYGLNHFGGSLMCCLVGFVLVPILVIGFIFIRLTTYRGR